MCWFEWALTDTYWEQGFRPIPGLGFVQGGCRVHYSDQHEEQQERLHAAVRVGAVPPTIAIDDAAAVLYREGMIAKVVSWHPGRTAYHVRQRDDTIEETACPVDLILATSLL
jgi:hypothetical protein